MGKSDKDSDIFTTSLRVKKCLWKKFELKCVEEEMTLTKGLEEALRAWVN